MPEWSHLHREGGEGRGGRKLREGVEEWRRDGEREEGEKEGR